MPKINVYLPDALAEAVRDAQVPVSAICQAALERAVRDVTSIRGAEQAPAPDRPGLGLFARFTPRARQALSLAEHAARDVPHDHVGTEHLLLGVIEEGGNLGVAVLESLDVEPGDLRAELLASAGSAEKAEEAEEAEKAEEAEEAATRVNGDLPFTPLAKRALELTAKEALALGHNYVGCEHLLLGLLATEAATASQVLRRMGLELRTTRRAVVTALSGFVHARTSLPSPAPSEAGAALAEILRRLEAIERRLSDS
jgi:ATP-dependent Clp protease ATP-binding subunit ClpA